MAGRRLTIALVALAALAVAFVLLRPDDDGGAAPETTPATTPPTVEPGPTTTGETATSPAPEPEQVRLVVTVRGGRPVGGIARARATQGAPILLVVRSDAADHVHVHGYDLFGDVGPGRPARLQFRASLTGRFEVELEDRHEQIAQLTVVP